MDRRTFLKTGSAAAVAGLASVAGCTADDGQDGEQTDGAQATDESTTGETGEETTTGATGEEDTDGDATGEETDGDGEEGEDDGGLGGEPGENVVGMVTEGDAYYFDPIGLLVESGTTVTFENVSDAHSSTAYHVDNDLAEETRIPEDAEPWDSGTLSEEGATFEHTFEVPGTYDYYCIPHKGLEMVGRIVVDEPGGPAEGTMPPDGDVPESDRIVEEEAVAYEDFA